MDWSYPLDSPGPPPLVDSTALSEPTRAASLPRDEITKVHVLCVLHCIRDDGFVDIPNMNTSRWRMSWLRSCTGSFPTHSGRERSLKPLRSFHTVEDMRI
jgi:hypothetical protein